MLVSRNPSTGEIVGEIPVTAAAEIPARIAAARAALPAWRDLGASGRAELIRPAGQRLLDRADELGELLCAEMGKPLAEAKGEVKAVSAGLAEELEEIIEALAPQTLRDGRSQSVIYRDPLGVCAAITPWNFPMMMPHWMVLPALMAGNTVVLKPSEETPLIAQRYVEILGAGLPDSVLQVVHGDEVQGKALVSADVDFIAFTGSREAGKHILSAAGAGLKRVLLELGGKDPLVVLDDADLDAAVGFAVRNSFRNAGQVCVSTERIYVAASIAAEFERRLAEQAATWTVGDGRVEGVRIGPMINGRQRAHVLRQIEEALASGARLLLDGRGQAGNFLGPTVLVDVSHHMEIMTAETFGPVACVQRFAGDEEAARLANDTPYGLSAVVFGGDEDRAAAVARRMQAGMVGINRGAGGASGSPWVGAKQSGYGFHGGPEGHRQFTQLRVISRAAG